MKWRIFRVAGGVATGLVVGGAIGGYRQAGCAFGFPEPPPASSSSSSSSSAGLTSSRYIDNADDFQAAECHPRTGTTCPRCRRRRRVAVYGGAFDPVTNGHLSCAAEIVHSGLADEVLMVPCGPRPDKPNMKTKSTDRYVMLQIAVNTSFSPGFPVRVSDIEIYEKKSLATYDMLSLLRERSPGVEFMFVVGSDWLQSGQDLRQWTSKEGKTGDKLVNEFDFLIIKRPGYDLPENLEALGPRFSVLSLPHGMNYVDSNVSSTEIRKRVAVSEQVREFMAGNHLTSADGLVPPGVLSYIQRQGLYKSSPSPR